MTIVIALEQGWVCMKMGSSSQRQLFGMTSSLEEEEEEIASLTKINKPLVNRDLKKKITLFIPTDLSWM